MSHLGDRLSALVDGELDGAERDRAHAHLAGCAQCRTEAAELRALKQKLRGLTLDAPSEAAMTRRLVAMAGPGGPLPSRRRLPRSRTTTASKRAPTASKRAPTASKRATTASKRATTASKRAVSKGGPPRSGRRRRQVVLSAIGLVIGLGTAAFTVGGGGGAAPGPKITPQVEIYSVEHAITTGEVPFADTSGLPPETVTDAPTP
jgi:anti-sigma factor RsiW